METIPEESIGELENKDVKQLDETSIVQVQSQETIVASENQSPIMNETISSAIPLPFINESPFIPRKRPYNVRKGTLLTGIQCFITSS